jgi:hypothetical protein
MIVDCQGCYDASKKTFVLTDPAVHCLTYLRFGGTNFGERGFNRFFKTHVCNEFCLTLGLKKPV